MQKGQGLILVLIGILVIMVVAGGTFYLGRSTRPKIQPIDPVVTSSPQPTLIPSPDPDPELTFPSPCISPSVNPICISSASRLKIYNNLNNLIRDSELIVVGRVRLMP